MAREVLDEELEGLWPGIEGGEEEGPERGAEGGDEDFTPLVYGEELGGGSCPYRRPSF